MRVPTKNRWTMPRAAALLFIAMLVVLLQHGTARPAWAATLTVNSGNDVDDGVCNATHCSLREAINAANASSSADTIAFNLPIGFVAGEVIGTFVRSELPIVVGRALPRITAPVTIDGTTQPNFAGSPRVEIRGPGGTVDGLVFGGGSDGSVVKGLAINGFGGAGVRLNFDSVGVRLEGNHIGTNRAGSAAAPNGTGVIMGGRQGTVGGTSAAARNVISGNTGSGVLVRLLAAGTTPDGNRVRGNYIGTNAAGTAALGNGDEGVGVGESSNTTVGGGTNILQDGTVTASARNVISGNRGNGVGAFRASGLQVLGNYIGTNAAGTAALPNAQAGVLVERSPGTVIGGPPAVSAPPPPSLITVTTFFNVIGGNGGDGILLSSDPTDSCTGFATCNSTVQDNVIGVTADGSAALGNGGNGVTFTAHSERNTITRNIIANSGGDGVSLFFTRNTLRSNKIRTNTGVGIRNARTTDPLSTHVPRLNSARTVSDGTTVTGQLISEARQETITMEFFASASCDPSGRGEGERVLATSTVATDSGGNASFTVTLPPVPAGQVITATLTDEAGTTSEFSACAAVTT
jgi:CSLREA domain-containing protein